MAEEPQWNTDLVGTAYDIAESDSKRMRVLAGPGTGKTYAMKRRVMRLLQQGIDPEAGASLHVHANGGA